MSRDTILTDEEGNTYSLDSLATQKWLNGHRDGLDQCCDYLERKAAALFAGRKREQAIDLQNLVDELKRELRPSMVTRAEEHEKEFPWRLNKATAKSRRTTT